MMKPIAKTISIVIAFGALCAPAQAEPAEDNLAKDSVADAERTAGPAFGTEEYRAQGEADMARLISQKPRTGPAKNVIIFIGDGMGVSTLTAARVYQGQQKGLDGESFVTAMDMLPYAALVKTYNHDAQVSDSASTATAFMSGVKTRSAVLGLGPEAVYGQCEASKGADVQSLIEAAERRGLASGIVSTARITHATPASTYAHSPNRNWENDGDLTEEAKAAGCKDIASQLIDWPVGNGFEVMLGGGRENFRPDDIADPEYPAKAGGRADGQDLAAKWLDNAAAEGDERHYVTDKAGFDAVDPATADRLLGLFEPSHMQYEIDRLAGAEETEPSLADMTDKAIAILSKNSGGYVLMVEGGRIDHGHHAGNAARALSETVALDEAVARAIAMIDLDETLVLVTSDHSHVFTMAGYPARGNPVLGVVADQDGNPILAADGKPYTTLGYANGAGAVEGPRTNITESEATDPDYHQQALVPLRAETHAGEDVAARAAGPGADLVRGTIEQHLLYYIMRNALGWDLNQP